MRYTDSHLPILQEAYQNERLIPNTGTVFIDVVHYSGDGGREEDLSDEYERERDRERDCERDCERDREREREGERERDGERERAILVFVISFESNTTVRVIVGATVAAIVVTVFGVATSLRAILISMRGNSSNAVSRSRLLLLLLLLLFG